MAAEPWTPQGAGLKASLLHCLCSTAMRVELPALQHAQLAFLLSFPDCAGESALSFSSVLEGAAGSAILDAPLQLRAHTHSGYSSFVKLSYK